MSKLHKGIIKYLVSLVVMATSFGIIVSSMFDIGYEMGRDLDE